MFLQGLLICLLCSSIFDTAAGLNCSVEDCGDTLPCPPDSSLRHSSCVCAPERCPQPPICPYAASRVLKHQGSRKPGDCCDVFECDQSPELNCTNVVCPEDPEDCPGDSYKLPSRQGEADCCSRPQGCACKPAICPEALHCPPHHRLQVLQPGNGLPGSCCPRYQCLPHGNSSCQDREREVNHGLKWNLNECTECSCSDGQIRCESRVVCPQLPDDCPATHLPPGQCCQVCVYNHDLGGKPQMKPGGCKSARGVIYKNGAGWREDDCTTCVCEDGHAQCQSELCHLSCSEYYTVPGECCPRCKSGRSVVEIPHNCTPPADCSLKCKHGFVEDQAGCYTCNCKAEECHLECKAGLLKDGSGVEICECARECPPLTNCNKKCKHGFRTNKEGCEMCKCDHCKPVFQCSLNCTSGYQTNEKGCRLCKCKEAKTVNQTALLFSENDCVTEEGNVRFSGESWGEGCRECFCVDGHEMCTLISCPRLDCPITSIHSSHSCCPVCLGDESTEGGSSGGVGAGWEVCEGPDGLRQEGERWSKDCLECVCHRGLTLCRSPLCPPALCQHPLRQDCCPVCPDPDSTLLEVSSTLSGCGANRPEGTRWRRDDCTSCICLEGVATCYSEVCDQFDSTCKNQVKIKNQCCPLCMDEVVNEDTCLVGNLTFKLGESWEPELCKRCTCQEGRSIVCTEAICDRPCTNSNSPCCPKCTDTSPGEGNVWFHGPVYLILICVAMFGLGAASAVLWRECRLRRHQLKICQPVSQPYQYKYVATFDQTTPSPHRSPV